MMDFEMDTIAGAGAIRFGVTKPTIDIDGWAELVGRRAATQ